MPEKDYLTDDPPINNQEWACVSLITPELVKGCSKRFIKVRGIYGNKDRAIDRCKQLSQIDSIYSVYTVEVGKWIAWSDKKGDDRDLNDLLNKLMELYLKERADSIKRYNKRKDDLVKENSKDHDIFSDLEKDSTEGKKNLQLEDLSKLDKSKYKEIKYLEEDPEINSQKFCCVSYLMPEQLEDKNLHDFGVRGFKIRQVFGNENDALAKCKKFYELENHHDTFIGNVGHWLEWTHSPSVENSEYANEDLGKLMKAHEENEEKVKSFNNKNDVMNESIGNLDESNRFDFLNEIIEEDEDDEINLESIDNELNNVNSELDEARKKYIEMLKEESSKK